MVSHPWPWGLDMRQIDPSARWDLDRGDHFGDRVAGQPLAHQYRDDRLPAPPADRVPLGVVHTHFGGAELRAQRDVRGLSLNDLGKLVHRDAS